MGAYDFVLRPFEREQLIFAVKRALEYRRLKLENLFLRDRLGVGSGIEIPRNLLQLN
jgi:DNA-binding NtrC family response regulator